MTKSKKLYAIIALSIVAVLLLVLGTIYDLQISKALASVPGGQYYTTNVFAIIGECFGDLVMFILIMCACAIIFFYLQNFPLKQKWHTITLQIIICLFGYIAAFYSFYKTLKRLSYFTSFGLDEYVTSVIGIISMALLSVVIIFLVFYLINKLNTTTLQALFKWAIVVLVASIASMAIIQFLKHIFDRTRFRAMIYSGDEEFAYFTHWFTINKNKFSTQSIYANDFFKSFPSGHTSGATSIFLLVILPKYLNALYTKKHKTILWSVASIYTFLIAFSRIVAGAHFFTDVYISFLITIAIIFAANCLVNLFFKKFVKAPDNYEQTPSQEEPNNNN